MAKKFHENEFDDATQVKLDVFRGYIRKWIPVFLTAWKGGNNPQLINHANQQDRMDGIDVESRYGLYQGQPRLH